MLREAPEDRHGGATKTSDDEEQAMDLSQERQARHQARMNRISLSEKRLLIGFRVYFSTSLNIRCRHIVVEFLVKPTRSRCLGGFIGPSKTAQHLGPRHLSTPTFLTNRSRTSAFRLRLHACLAVRLSASSNSYTLSFNVARRNPLLPGTSVTMSSPPVPVSGNQGDVRPPPREPSTIYKVCVSSHSVSRISHSLYP